MGVDWLTTFTVRQTSRPRWHTPHTFQNISLPPFSTWSPCLFCVLFLPGKKYYNNFTWLHSDLLSLTVKDIDLTSRLNKHWQNYSTAAVASAGMSASASMSVLTVLTQEVIGRHIVVGCPRCHGCNVGEISAGIAFLFHCVSVNLSSFQCLEWSLLKELVSEPDGAPAEDSDKSYQSDKTCLYRVVKSSQDSRSSNFEAHCWSGGCLQSPWSLMLVKRDVVNSVCSPGGFNRKLWISLGDQVRAEEGVLSEKSSVLVSCH